MPALLREARANSRWIIPGLIAIVFVSALLYTWNIGFSGLSTYYAAAAKSMSSNWRALFFGALNPSATTTLDKLSGFLVPQALSARIFGFSAWSLALPQAVEGVISVLTSYVIGARWRGPRFGLALAFLMAFTPMLAAMFGRPMEDGMMTMCSILAFAAAQRAVLSARFGWLLVAMFWVAVGFQAKMMQAWLILPAIGVMWFLGNRISRAKRVIQLAVATVVAGVLSVSWMTAIQLVPASARPYVDGTTNNNMFSMVFGYNGFDRIIPGIIPGSIAQLYDSRPNVVNATATSSAAHSVFKLLLPEFTTQIGWLFPLALAGIVLVVLRQVRMLRARDEFRGARVHTSRAHAIAVGLVLWLLVPAAVLSIAFVPHATYFAQFALPVGALALAGFLGSVAAYRSRAGRRWIILPGVIAAETVWSLAIILESPGALRFFGAPVAVFGAASVALLCWLHPRADRQAPGHARLVASALAFGIAASLIAPMTWASYVVLPGGGGSASDAFAGIRMDPLSPFVAARREAETDNMHQMIRPPFEVPPGVGLDRQQRRLLAYIEPRNDGRQVFFVTDSMPIAVSFLISTDRDTVPIGGFSRAAPDPGDALVQHLLSTGAARYVLLNGARVARQSAGNASVTEVRRWVIARCVPVFVGKFHAGTHDHQKLYDCAAARHRSRD